MHFYGRVYESVKWVGLTQGLRVQNWALLTMLMKVGCMKVWELSNS